MLSFSLSLFAVLMYILLSLPRIKINTISNIPATTHREKESLYMGKIKQNVKVFIKSEKSTVVLVVQIPT
jgi:hypothetical protein